MAHRFIAKTFIRDAAVGDHTVSHLPGNLPDDVEYYLTAKDSGGASNDIDEVIAVTSCKLKGDRVFVLVVIEDQFTGG